MTLAPLTDSAQAEPFPRFDLDFPGGTPKELVDAIHAAGLKEFNVVLPPEQSEIEIPPLKMRQVNVSDLFNAISQASLSTAPRTAAAGYLPIPATHQQARRQGYSFQTTGLNSHSVWYLIIASNGPAPAPPARICKYYQLAPYLKDLKIDDITTAIEAGWKMLHIANPPELNFHKDTKIRGRRAWRSADY
jgi:hypothetical protein